MDVPGNNCTPFHLRSVRNQRYEPAERINQYQMCVVTAFIAVLRLLSPISPITPNEFAGDPAIRFVRDWFARD